tara:strand:- start:3752 stop:4132 length:381 start_codon:yes stop_codon:yes gene_type:complete
MINSSKIGYGDIILESTQIDARDDKKEILEVARYIIVGKYIEEVYDKPFQLKEYETEYFKVIMLYINKQNQSTWAQQKKPGSRYLLSEHEITNYHDWSFINKLDLNWPSGSIEVGENGTKWDEGDW